jgi:magnesium-transporting ATPase (P-type)
MYLLKYCYLNLILFFFLLHNYSSAEENRALYHSVRLMMQRTFSSGACSLALARFYARLSRVPDHRIPDNWSFTVLSFREVNGYVSNTTATKSLSRLQISLAYSEKPVWKIESVTQPRFAF